MKISKLFHWLYASLMLLPLMVFGVTGLYYGLNQNAQLSETSETIENYFTTTLNEDADDNYYLYEDIEFGSIYKLSLNSNMNGISDIEIDTLSYCMPLNTYDSIYNNTLKDYQLYFYYSDGIATIITPGITYEIYTEEINCYIVFNQNTQGSNALANLTEDIPFQGTDILIPNGTNTTTTYTNDISTSIINAWNSTWQNPLFNWSSESFLIAPFNYITDLFSIPQNNTFSMALSYWLAISIVYLIFDLVMYVPLLAHRWIDKGMVE